jgi:hypothetical protein
MTRDEGRVIWQQIADRRFTHEVLEWLAQIAPLVLEADRLKDAYPRRAGIVDAVGLGGRTGTMITALVKQMEEHIAKHGVDGRTPQERRKVRDVTMALTLGAPLVSLTRLNLHRLSQVFLRGNVGLVTP